MATISPVQDNESGKPYRRLPISSDKGINILQGTEHSMVAQGMKIFNMENSKKMENVETEGAISVADEYEMRSEKDACRTTSEVIEDKHDEVGHGVNLTGFKEDQRCATKDHMVEIVVSDDEGYTVDNVLPESRHCDGSIYRDTDFWWKQDFCIADRNETRVKLSDPSDCIMVNGSCLNHAPCGMLQIFSLDLAKLPVDGGLVELYGYVAVRDDLDPLLNYVVNISRDEPITLQEGSLIKMAGPKRGIFMIDLILLEYDMRIKTGEQEKDDIPLIDGASLIGRAGIWNDPFRFHISSDRGVVGITLSRIDYAVEAAVEVLISEVQNRFSLSLGCLTSGLNEKIRLFDGAIAESCVLKRYVIAVMSDSLIDLTFKVARIQQDNDNKESTLRAYRKEEPHTVQSQVENKRREATNAKKKKGVNSYGRMQQSSIPNILRNRSIWSRDIPRKVSDFVQILNKRHLHSLAERELTKLRKLSIPGNTGLVLLDEYNPIGSKRSFRRAISKARAWCRANTKYVDLSKYFGPGAGVYTTPPTGTFHLTYLSRHRKNKKAKIRERRLTIFLHGRNFYVRGWRSKNGLFEIQSKKQNYRYIDDPACVALKIGKNYHDYRTRGEIEQVRIGLLGTMDHFDVLEKCDGQVSYAELAAIAGFCVNGPEAIRLSEVEEEMLASYDGLASHDGYDLVYLGSRRRSLSMQIRKYGHYSGEYLKCVDALVQGLPIPDILNSGGLKINSVEELMKMIKVPLRATYICKTFNHEASPDSDIWSPPSLESMKEDEFWVEEDKNLEEEEDGDDGI